MVAQVSVPGQLALPHRLMMKLNVPSGVMGRNIVDCLMVARNEGGALGFLHPFRRHASEYSHFFLLGPTL